MEKKTPEATDNKPKIMLVDDQSILLEAITLTLTQNGYHVDGFTSAADALHAYRSFSDYFAVITDLLMPDMEGDELLQEIQELKSEQACIVITGHSEKKLIMKAAKIGNVNRILLKPLKENELLTALEEIKQHEVLNIAD